MSDRLNEDTAIEDIFYNSKLKENKIALIFICDDENIALQQKKNFLNKKINTNVFGRGVEFEVRFVIKNETLSKICNQIIKSTDAKYKIFITTPVVMFDVRVITTIITTFLHYPKVGMVGLVGSEMPVSGDYTKAQNFYGAYFHKGENGEGNGKIFKPPFYYQSVHIIDSSIFATSENILFDEEVGKDFVIAAQCCRYRRAGYDVGVSDISNPFIVFSHYNSIYQKNFDIKDYEEQLKFFKDRYKDIVTPLVSICIPTYNQKDFLEETLKSALKQTYDNIEIIIGDDSTNEDTKKMIQPYLERYKNIKYFYHGGPLGNRGGKNTTFIINKTSGEYINVLFHDDIIAPEKISYMMKYFVSDLENRISLIVSKSLNMDEKNNVIGQWGEYKPSKDVILRGEDVGRKMFFLERNLLGYISVGLFKKKDLLTKDAETGEKIFDMGIFGGVKDFAHGDLGTWYNLLKSGGDCVFISNPLSTYRTHSSPTRNSNNSEILIRLYVEKIGYITIAWLNNIFLHTEEDYRVACRRWLRILPDHMSINPENKDVKDKIIFFANKISELKKLIFFGKFDEVLDASIKILLEMLPEKNSIRPLIVKNEVTGLWQKADDGIMLHGVQRY